MSNLRINVFPVVQPIGTLYIGKINYSDLFSMSVVDRRHIISDDEVLGIQREIKEDKVKQIKKYLTTSEATFPNSIILNVKNENVVSNTGSVLELKQKDDTFTIIDGQHRLAGFEDYQGPDFELIVTIFIELRIDQQAEIFSTINSQQTKVDPSLNVSLILDDRYFTPRKMIVEIAQSFNYDRESPWYNSIKMLGANRDGFISLSAFARPLFELTYPERDWYLIKNAVTVAKNKPADFSFDKDYSMVRYPFWPFYKNGDSASVYKILTNYFLALSNILSDDWLNADSILNKTTGYNAIMRLFKELVPACIESHSFSYEFFFRMLSPLEKLDGSINSYNYGTSGTYSSNQLYKDIKEALVQK